jgi:hypothetical protein
MWVGHRKATSSLKTHPIMITCPGPSFFFRHFRHFLRLRKSLIWALVLLALIIYFFAIIFTQAWLSWLGSSSRKL